MTLSSRCVIRPTRPYVPAGSSAISIGQCLIPPILASAKAFALTVDVLSERISSLSGNVLAS